MRDGDWWTRALRRRARDEEVAEKTEIPTYPRDPRDHWPSDREWEALRQLPERDLL